MAKKLDESAAPSTARSCGRWASRWRRCLSPRAGTTIGTWPPPSSTVCSLSRRAFPRGSRGAWTRRSTMSSDMSLVEPRALVARARRVIVKVGSSSLAAEGTHVLERLAETIAARKVTAFGVGSNGAIALGVKKLGYRARPKEMSKLQAAAAPGQSLLMRAYEEAFAVRGMAVAQVLLSHADLADRTRGNNARAALSELLDAGAVPILNENDSVAVDEIKFGDNDQLAAMVVPLIDADLVVLLSDVEGLLDADARRVSIV